MKRQAVRVHLRTNQVSRAKTHVVIPDGQGGWQDTRMETPFDRGLPEMTFIVTDAEPHLPSLASIREHER